MRTSKIAVLAVLFLTILAQASPKLAQEFTLTSTAANLTSSRASIDIPGLTASPWAIIVATPIGDTEMFNPNPIGVWYDASKWNLFKTNHAVMALGIRYKIRFFPKPGPNQFVHIMSQQNIGAEGSYIDHPGLNYNPFQILQVHAPDVRPYNPNWTEWQPARYFLQL